LGVAGQRLWVWQVKGLGVAGQGFVRGTSRVWAWQVKVLGVAGQGFFHLPRVQVNLRRVSPATRGGSHLPRVAGRAAGLTCHAWRFEIQPFFCFQFVPFFGGVLIIMCSFDMIAPFCPFRASIYFSQLDV